MTSTERSGGRPRDASRDAAILEATLDVLAEDGYERTTMDAVAARAGAGKATVYRRWASKPELVRDAVARLAGPPVTLEALPDTGSFREDMRSLGSPRAAEGQARKLRVMGGLAAAVLHDRALAEAVEAAVLRPWVEVNRLLLQRAVDRGELPAATQVDVLAPVLPSIISFRSLVAGEPVPLEDIHRLLDVVLLPAIHGADTVP